MSITVSKYIFWCLLSLPFLVLGFLMCKSLLASFKELRADEKQRKAEQAALRAEANSYELWRKAVYEDVDRKREGRR